VVIDDAIIVLENIERHREMGKNARDAAIDGTRQITFAATAATMAVLAAGLPGSAAVAVHLVPLPYNIITAVGIWRSAGNHDGARFWADMARVAAVALAVGLTLI